MKASIHVSCGTVCRVRNSRPARNSLFFRLILLIPLSPCSHLFFLPSSTRQDYSDVRSCGSRPSFRKRNPPSLPGQLPRLLRLNNYDQGSFCILYTVYVNATRTVNRIWWFRCHVNDEIVYTTCSPHRFIVIFLLFFFFVSRLFGEWSRRRRFWGGFYECYD